MSDDRICPDCHEVIHGCRWNGRCYDCHEAACAFPLGGDLAPAGFDPGYAGERWDSDY